MEIRYAAFDLDGTLVRGETCVVSIARAIGRVDECLEFEKLSMRDTVQVSAAREAMAEWYREHSTDELCRELGRLTLAPGTKDAFRLLRSRSVETAIVSITWSFAAEWFAQRLGADEAYGTRLTDSGIDHVWPSDKGRWLEERKRQLGLSRDAVAAVGDSDGDRELLTAAGLRFSVGTRPLEGFEGVVHLPNADMLDVAKRIVEHR